MLIDDALEFCDAVSVAKTAGASYLLGDQIDTSVIRNLGDGEPLWFVITVDTEIITAGSTGSIRFKLVSDDSASISTTTSTVHLQTGEFVTDDAVANPFPAGSILFAAPLPSLTYKDNDYERYLGVLVTVTTTDTTAGKINAFLTRDPPGGVTKKYADASN